MLILPQLVSQMHDAALVNLHLVHALGPVPAQRRKISPMPARQNIRNTQRIREKTIFFGNEMLGA